MSKLSAAPASVRRLEDIPNVGKAVADILRRIGIHAPAQLTGRDPFELYAEFNAVSGICNDPCLLDTFIAATRFMGGEPARPWWAYTVERKARLGNRKD